MNRLRLRCLFVLLVPAVSCAVPAPVEPGTLPEGVDLAYTLERIVRPSLSLRVAVTAAGSLDGATLFTIDRCWGGSDNCPDEIRDLGVRGQGGRVLSAERTEPNKWRVEHAPGEVLRLAYSLLPARSHGRERHRYLPVVTDDYIQIIGHTGLVFPEHLLGRERCNTEIRWKGFAEPGWRVVSSFSRDRERYRVHRPLDALRHSFFIAGKLRITTRRVGGAPLHVAVAGDEWRFSDAAFSDRVVRIMAFERSFFNDFDHPPYTVCLVPYPYKEPDASSSGGTCLTDSFILFLPPRGYAGKARTGLEPIETLIAHEYFHNWNHPGPEDDAMHWFSEGFTVFYERRILLRLGLFSLDEYADHLNSRIRKYTTSPYRETPNEVYVRSKMLDRSISSLPYLRGDMIAVLTDHEIRTVSKGNLCLDDLMRELVRRTDADGENPSSELVFDLIEEFTSAAFARKIRGIAVDGDAVAFESGTFCDLLEMRRVPVYAFDMGFDFEGSRETRVVTNVRKGSSAYEAGLRNGQKLAGWSVHLGDADRPVKLTIVEKGEKRSITYLPRSSPIEMPQFFPR